MQLGQNSDVSLLNFSDASDELKCLVLVLHMGQVPEATGGGMALKGVTYEATDG